GRGDPERDPEPDRLDGRPPCYGARTTVAVKPQHWSSSVGARDWPASRSPCRVAVESTASATAATPTGPPVMRSRDSSFVLSWPTTPNWRLLTMALGWTRQQLSANAR